MLNVIDIISAVLGLTTVILAGRNSKYNFWVGYVYCAFLTVLFWRQHLYSAMILQPISLAINVYGHWRWTHPQEDERSSEDSSRLKVGKLTVNQLGGMVLIVCVFGAAWANCLEWLPQRWPNLFQADPSPWLDAYVLMLTLFAQYLSAQKVWECWLVWLVVNVANLILYISAGLYAMPVVSALYLINGVISLIHWRRLNKKDA